MHRDITVKGSFDIGDKESLVMTYDDAQISGIITKYENSFTRKDVKELSYWSSPIGDAEIQTVFSNVDPSRIFLYDQSKTSASSPSNDPNNDYWNAWTIASGMMTPAIGYASEGPQNTTGVHEISFKGIPNNGIVTIGMKGNFTDQDFLNDFNFIGNPYASGIEIETFLSKNTGIIDPTVYLWAHNTEKLGEDYTSSFYLTYNLLGGTELSSEGIEMPSKYIKMIWVPSSSIRYSSRSSAEMSNALPMETNLLRPMPSLAI